MSKSKKTTEITRQEHHERLAFLRKLLATIEETLGEEEHFSSREDRLLVSIIGKLNRIRKRVEQK